MDMCKSWNNRVSFTFNNQEGVRNIYDWVVILHAFLAHLIGIYCASWLVVDVMSSDEPVAEGIVFFKMTMFVSIYVCVVLLSIMITGLPAVASWAESNQKEKSCKIKLL